METDMENLIGKKYNRLKILEIIKSKKDKDKHLKAKCLCDCGKISYPRLGCLIRGKIVSCGCYVSEYSRIRMTKHNYYGTRIYKTWNGIMDRTIRKAPKYKDRYWGRGINICKEWECFENFKNWAFVNGYKDYLTIDRINNDGNYCPENCRWSTRRGQANNRSKNVFIEFKGELKTISEHCRFLNLNYHTILSRHRAGMKSPEIFTKPISFKKKELLRNVKTRA